ncbi:MAG TPA: glycosyltransferase family protein [Cyclobacteriaceae bacterium]|nr:glycosyltransferase family protein [Cyclobacteriaceae bacterium]
MPGCKKFIFLVQGEGRGHMTQAMGLYHMLITAGHKVVHVFIGKSDRRKIPAYFTESFSCPVEAIATPNFITDMDNKSIRLIPSIIYNAKFLRKYLKSMKKIHRAVKSEKPDYIINFYEFLGGFYNLLFRPSARHIPVGHQFLASHPSFPLLKNRVIDHWLFLINNFLTSLKAYKIFALSFSEYDPWVIKNIVICPPLLRPDLDHFPAAGGTYILGYMVNDGYAGQVIEWHSQNRDTEVNCFWDRKGEPEEKMVDENLRFHQLSGEKFMLMMAGAKGLVTTAGFESVCEAMYFGKPVMMIPVEGQYEQACNAIDAANAGAGIAGTSFDLSRLIRYIPEYKPVDKTFKAWLAKAENIILKELD